MHSRNAVLLRFAQEKLFQWAGGKSGREQRDPGGFAGCCYP